MNKNTKKLLKQYVEIANIFLTLLFVLVLPLTIIGTIGMMIIQDIFKN